MIDAQLVRVQVWSLGPKSLIWRNSVSSYYAKVRELLRRGFSKHGPPPPDDVATKIVRTAVLCAAWNLLPQFHLPNPTASKQTRSVL